MREGFTQNFPELNLINEVQGVCAFYEGHCVDFHFRDMSAMVDPGRFVAQLHDMIADHRGVNRDIPYYLIDYERGALAVVSHGQATVAVLLDDSTYAEYIITYVLGTLKQGELAETA